MGKYDFTPEKPRVSDYGITEADVETYKAWKRSHHPESYDNKSFYEKRCQKISITFWVVCGIFFVLLIVFFATGLIAPAVVFTVLGVVSLLAGFIFLQVGDDIAVWMCKRENTHSPRDYRLDLAVKKKVERYNSAMEEYDRKMTCVYRWEYQKEKDIEFLNSGTPAVRELKNALAIMEAERQAYEYFHEDEITGGEEAASIAEGFILSLTATLFLKMYYVFKNGDLFAIKNEIYKERPYMVHDWFTDMGLFIFRTHQNFHVLNYIIENKGNYFPPEERASARYVLAAET